MFDEKEILIMAEVMKNELNAESNVEHLNLRQRRSFYSNLADDDFLSIPTEVRNGWDLHHI